ncbi:ATP-grasp domain-containing protein [Hymenobacter volaticus]|uniref:ATP-grasp domain-containing protein n=1 Tax=Hymenobacter volaticus TaxID=2932254 RepID=A0ABY4G677_9BACT|nr:ATP-grasp domain-containing protein [Hymenobacter volaticus]UOQ66303.1 ATP-grasp domain-containing protein [Hymenobacter volaticus]
MHIVYPSLPYEPQTIDPMWEAEFQWARNSGIEVALFDTETGKLFPRQSSMGPALYRGWMLTESEYEALEQLTPLHINKVQYLSSHQATGWYNQIAAYTFASAFQLASAQPDFAGGQRYFVKGVVKSFGADSVVASGAQYKQLLEKHQVAADEVLFVREFAELKPESERRFFVVAGAAYGAEQKELPAELHPVLALLAPRLFYSLDVVQLSSGRYRVVEVGDGQVSDLKEWDVTDFGETVLKKLAVVNP